MSRYTNQLSRWREGKLEPTEWKECKLEECHRQFPVFNKSTEERVVTCDTFRIFNGKDSLKHGKKLRSRGSSKKPAVTGLQSYVNERPPHVTKLCKPILGECAKYAEGFSLETPNKGCWGEKLWKEDGSCYVEPNDRLVIRTELNCQIRMPDGKIYR